MFVACHTRHVRECPHRGCTHAMGERSGVTANISMSCRYTCESCRAVSEHVPASEACCCIVCVSHPVIRAEQVAHTIDGSTRSAAATHPQFTHVASYPPRPAPRSDASKGSGAHSRCERIVVRSAAGLAYAAAASAHHAAAAVLCVYIVQCSAEWAAESGRDGQLTVPDTPLPARLLDRTLCCAVLRIPQRRHDSSPPMPQRRTTHMPSTTAPHCTAAAAAAADSLFPAYPLHLGCLPLSSCSQWPGHHSGYGSSVSPGP